jgi:hypothetical protein
MLVAVRRGLADVGYAEGCFAIETRFAAGHYDRLSVQLSDLTQREVSVIVTANTSATSEGLLIST